MINIEIDLVPMGFLAPKKLKSIKIWNDGTGTKYVGNYGYELLNKNGTTHRKGHIEGFRRKSKNVFELLALCLNDAGYGSSA